jgi:restriction endonuclease S subunit
LPISSNSAVPLFIQAIIYILNIGGRCAVVLPEGQELFSKNRALAAVREFLMKTCDLKEVIYLPAGTFTHTSIKTCVLYFHKKKEGKDVLKIDIKISPTTQQEIQRDYKFSATHQTHKVAFYDYNPSNGVKHLHVEVNISDIAKKNYSLNYAEYLKDDAEDAIYEEGVVVKSLGDVCNFDIGGTPSRSNIEYYQNGTNYWLSVRELNGGHIFDTNEKITDLGVNKSSVKLFPVGTVLFSFKLSIGKTAVAGVPLYTNEAIAGLNTKNENMLLNKYLYHYLTVNDFTQHGSGMLGNGSLNKKSLYDIKIPIPPLEKQQEIVKYMDFIYETANKSSEQKIKELKQLNEYCLNMQKGFGLNSIKPLGEVIESVKTGIDIVAESRIKGIYPFYGANGIIDNVNCFLFDGKYLLTARTGSLGSLHITDGKFWCTGDVHCIKFNDDITLSYIYQYLHTIDFQKFRTGAAHPKLSGSALKSINIHIPDIERQKEIVEYCEYNDNLIKQLEREIEQNKKQAQMFLANIIKVVGTKPATESETITPANEPSDQVTPVTNDDAVSVTSSSSEPNPQAELDPAKFEQEYLSQQSLSNLKQMKKQYKIRAKVTEDTVEEYVRILREWYVKQTAEKPKKRTKKPVVTQHTIEQVTNTALTLDVTVPTA